MEKKISIVILNWNGLADTLECIKSIKEIDYPNFDIIIADNGSTDASLTVIPQKFPDVILVKNGMNLGYAEGNNRGIRYAIEHGADFILVLNNDTTVAKGILTEFVKASRKYPEGGIFGAKIYYYSEPALIFSAGTKWDPVRCIFDHIGCGKPDGEQYSKEEETEYVCGCAIFFRKEVVEKVGLFDPQFFLCFEETDWCFRAKRAGFKVMYIPMAKLWHKISVSFGGVSSPTVNYYLTRNRLLWYKKNIPSLRKRLKYSYALFKDLFSSCYEAKEHSFFKRLYWDLLKLNTPEGHAQILGVMDYYLGRLGNGEKTLARFKKKR